MITEGVDIQIYAHGEARDRCPDRQRGQRLKSLPKILISRSSVDSRRETEKRVPVSLLQSISRVPLFREANRP